MSCELVIVRHGERLDEMPGNTFYADEPHRWFDPPLTDRGVIHANAMAHKLSTELAAEGPAGFNFISTSPLLRTVQTAASIAAILGMPLRVVPGLCECAAAVHSQGLDIKDDNLVLKKSGLPFYTRQELKDRCPIATWSSEQPEWIAPFEETVIRLCEEAVAAGHRRALVVSHREGIRDLAGRHQRLSTPYCCVSRFTYEVSLGRPSLTLRDSRELVKWVH